MPKLNQLLAIERNVKNKREDQFTQLYQDVQKGDLLTGFSKTYQPRDESGEVHPPQTKRVQVRADETLKAIKRALVDVFDVTASKDATNCEARADVVVDGRVVLKAVPVTHLLFLEKRLVDLQTLVNNLPVLSQDEQWERDEAQGLWKTAAAETASTKKIVDYNVVVPATKEHPAQVKETTKDVIVGSWKTVKFSGALTKDYVRDLAERVDRITRAVKFAREDANQREAVPLASGEAILGFIFA